MNTTRPITIKISNEFQKDYTYTLLEPIGKNFDKGFNPSLTPKQMIDLGIFGGHYSSVNDMEFPKEWFEINTLDSKMKDPNKNYFGVNASQPLSVWQKKGWIFVEDPQGWFLWYCRYYMGRRIMPEDQRQIKRWKAMVRHVAQIQRNCIPKDLSCRKKQRQALLHWAYDSRIF